MTGLIIAAAVVLLIIIVLPEALPRPRDEFKDFEGWARIPAAHRGLAGPDAPENTAAAFRRAADAGLNIELDVRQCRDGLVIMHDGCVDLPSGGTRRVRDMTVAELKQLKLPGGAEIATLDEALEAVAGRVGLIIEIKDVGVMSAIRICDVLAPVLRAYSGPYCVESFNPWALRKFQNRLPDVPRGQLVPSFGSARKQCGMAAGWIFSNILLCPMSRPAFVAYEYDKPQTRGLKAWIRRGGRCAVWTVIGEDDLRREMAKGNIVIFEEEQG